MMELFNHIASTMSSVHSLYYGLGAGGIILSSFGALPKVGIGRAFVVAYQSKFSRLATESVRINHIKVLKENLRNLSQGRYIYVRGGNGKGKTTLVNTVIHGQYGVIKINVSSQTTSFVLYSFIID